MLKYVEYIKKNKLGWVYTTKTFNEITTLKIGGKIKLLFYAVCSAVCLRQLIFQENS